MKDKILGVKLNKGVFILVAFIACVLAGAVLKITASVIVPFVISVFLAFVINPMVRFLEKLHIARIFSIILAVGIIVTGLYVIGMVLFASGSTIFSLYPKYEARLTEIYLWISGLFKLPYDESLSFFENIWSQLGIRSGIMSFGIYFSNGLSLFLRGAGMVVLFVIFLLIEVAYINDKLEIAFKGSQAKQIKKVCADVVRQVSRYLSVKFIMSIVTGVGVGVGLRIIGLEFAVVWGLIQFFLNFIPFIGTVAINSGVFLFALLQFWPEPGPIIAVMLIVGLPNLIVGGILEPKIMGDSLGLSPIAILIALIFWGWIWGFAGTVLAVPMMVIIKIFCENIPFLEPLSILLGSRKAALVKMETND